MHPVVYRAKKLIEKFSQSHEIAMFCDMHGHSMKKNVFMYACSPNLDKKKKILMSLIPFSLSKTNKLFSFKGTKFRTEKFKQGAARVVLYKEFDIINSYTLEASFYGPEHQAALQNRDPIDGEPIGETHMNIDHLKSLGRDLCKQLLAFRSQTILQKKLNCVSNSLKTKLLKIPVEVEVDDDEDFNILNSLKMINEDEFRDLFSATDPNSSASDDSGDSEIDDKKQKYLISRCSKRKRPKSTLVKTQKMTSSHSECVKNKNGASFRRNSHSKIKKTIKGDPLQKSGIISRVLLLKDYLKMKIPNKYNLWDSIKTQSFSGSTKKSMTSRTSITTKNDISKEPLKSNRCLKYLNLIPFIESKRDQGINRSKNF